MVRPAVIQSNCLSQGLGQQPLRDAPASYLGLVGLHQWWVYKGKEKVVSTIEFKKKKKTEKRLKSLSNPY